MKICERCQKEYSNTSNRQKYCFDCASIVRKEYSRIYTKKWRRKWRKANPEKAKEIDKKNRIKYRDKRNKYNREYYRKNKDTKVYKERTKRWWANHPDKKKEYNRKYYLKNKDTEQYRKIQRKAQRKWYYKHGKEYEKERRTNVQYRLNRNMGKMIWEALKEKKAGRKWESLVNYTLKNLIEHLKTQFTDKMNWDNYGSYI